MSGYAEQEITRHGAQRHAVGFLQKPFTVAELHQILTTALSQAPYNAHR